MKKIYLQKLVLTLIKMKKIVFLIILTFISSCYKIENEENTINNSEKNISNNEIINQENLDKVKNLLKPEKNEIINITQTWNEIKKEQPIIQKKENKNNLNFQKNKEILKTENNIQNQENSNTETETWVLSQEELKIIENTSDWEIDELINILFQDVN